MKSIQPTTQFRKDLKRYKHQPKKLDTLKKVIKMLRDEIPLPAEYRPHMLLGRYKGCMECHIQGDFLLIWIDSVNDIIELVRLGSHSELFGNSH